MLLKDMPREEVEQIIRNNIKLRGVIREFALDEAEFMASEALKCFDYGTNRCTYEDSTHSRIHIEPLYWTIFIDGYLALDDEIPYFTDSESVQLMKETDRLIDTYDIASHGGHVSDEEYAALENTIESNIRTVADELEDKINYLYDECYNVDYLVEYYDNCYDFPPLDRAAVDSLGNVYFEK